MKDGEKSISESSGGGLSSFLHLLAIASAATIFLSTAIGLFIELKPEVVHNETLLECYQRTGGIEQCKPQA